jgi:hypothetical protein
VSAVLRIDQMSSANRWNKGHSQYFALTSDLFNLEIYTPTRVIPTTTTTAVNPSFFTPKSLDRDLIRSEMKSTERERERERERARERERERERER